MTALAMIIGMAPMALGLGEGGEQNAPLGRAVIGGLIFATCATLMFVPVVFSIVHGRKPQQSAHAPPTPNPEKPMPDDQRHAAATHRASALEARRASLPPASPSLVIVVAASSARVTRTSSVAAWTDEQALPDGERHQPRASAARPATSRCPATCRLQQRADLCARQRLSEELVCRHRRPVKAGQLLAEIDTPDQDQQLRRRDADLDTAVANQKLSGQTAKRWNALRRTTPLAPQDVDEKNGDLAAKTAAVEFGAGQCRSRCSDLANFKRITAPFDGMVTSRSTDVGSLMTVGAPGDAPLFTVSETGKLRIYVNVPQSYSAMIKPGMTAKFTVPEYPGETFTATLTATANAIDPHDGHGAGAAPGRQFARAASNPATMRRCASICPRRRTRSGCRRAR